MLINTRELRKKEQLLMANTRTYKRTADQSEKEEPAMEYNISFQDKPDVHRLASLNLLRIFQISLICYELLKTTVHSVY